VPRQLLVSSSIAGRRRAALERRIVKGGAKPQRPRDERLPTLYLVPASVSVPALVAELRAEFGPGVGPNHAFFGEPVYSGSPAGPVRSTPDAVTAGTGAAGASVTVAVLDTGMAADFARWFPTFYPGVTVVAPAGASDDPDVFPPAKQLDWEAGHGTFVAGIVGAQAPGATILVRRVLDSDGAGDELAIAAAILDATAAGAAVVNLSLGGYTADDEPPVAFTDALRHVPPTAVVVAAAGNNANGTRPFWPAASKDVVAVGAVDGSGAPATFTNFGFWVDACAPGVDVVSTFLGVKMAVEADPSLGVQDFGDHAARWSGTSFAAPRFAGAVAATMTKRGVDAQTAASLLLGSGPPVAGLGCLFDPSAV
jgi:Subtilase family